MTPLRYAIAHIAMVARFYIVGRVSYVAGRRDF